PERNPPGSLLLRGYLLWPRPGLVTLQWAQLVHTRPHSVLPPPLCVIQQAWGDLRAFLKSIQVTLVTPVCGPRLE
ncbi:unnamed protein product, partial [Gulo gulo]